MNKDELYSKVIYIYIENRYENISVYDIQNKTSKFQKSLRIRFNKIKGFIRARGDEFIHLVLFDYEFFDKMRDTIKYLIGKKSGITDSINHNFGEIRIDSFNSLPIEKKY